MEGNDMWRPCLCFLVLVSFLAGCAHFAPPRHLPTDEPETERTAPGEKTANRGQDQKPPKAMLEWAVGGKAEEEDEDSKGENDQKNGEKNNQGEAREGRFAEALKADKEPEPEPPIDTDRPDFGVATTTVGRGRAVLETGYSYFHDNVAGSHLSGHSYPEAVLRVGLFADWFEFRIGQNFANFRTTTDGGAAPPLTQAGAQDLYLGIKLALTEQKKWLPESVVVIQTTVPTGANSLSFGQMLPGIIYAYAWETIKDRLWFSGLIEADRIIDASNHTNVQIAQTAEVKLALTKRLRTFTEFVALMPSIATGPGVGPQYYIHPGAAFFLTNNIQLDAHIFFGLNAKAVDYFGGPGISVRY
jgi:hypothetical protein